PSEYFVVLRQTSSSSYRYSCCSPSASLFCADLRPALLSTLPTLQLTDLGRHRGTGTSSTPRRRVGGLVNYILPHSVPVRKSEKKANKSARSSVETYPATSARVSLLPELSFAAIQKTPWR